jgi:hypothetical protein
MAQVAYNKIVSFICGIADDALRGLVTRGKCPDVTLPIRRAAWPLTPEPPIS